MARAPPKVAKPPTQMDAEHAFKRRDWRKAWVARFAAACAFPDVVEVEQFGGPLQKHARSKCEFALASCGLPQTAPLPGISPLQGSSVCLSALPRASLWAIAARPVGPKARHHGIK